MGAATTMRVLLVWAAVLLQACVISATRSPEKLTARDLGLEHLYNSADSAVGGILNELDSENAEDALAFDPSSISSAPATARRSAQQHISAVPVTGEGVVEDVLLSRGVGDELSAVDLSRLQDIQERYRQEQEGAVLLQLDARAETQEPNTVMSDNDNYVRQHVEGSEEKRWDREEEGAKRAVVRNQKKRIEEMQKERVQRLSEEKHKQQEADVKWKRRDDTAREMRQLTVDASVKARAQTRQARKAWEKQQDAVEEHHKKAVAAMRVAEQAQKTGIAEQAKKTQAGWGVKEQQLRADNKKRREAWNKKQEQEGKALAKEMGAKQKVEATQKREQNAKRRAREALQKKARREEARAKELKSKAAQRERELKARQAERSRKAMEKDKKRREREERNKFTGLCTFQRTNKPFASACPAGWKNHGLAGIILRDSDYSHNPFHRGGRFNGGWTWSHPYLCCAESDEARMDDLFVMNKQCAGGAHSLGLFGLIMYNQHYSQNPFHRGGGFNGGWTWTHPFVCEVKDNDMANAKGNCLMGKSCPKGWVNRGLAGVILLHQHYSLNPFHGGGDFNGGWHWAHPYLCCRG